jgi:hypothetical protein
VKDAKERDQNVQIVKRICKQDRVKDVKRSK